MWTAVAEAERLKVIEAEDGRQAIEILTQDANFDLVILDVNMPFVEGYEVLRHMRQDDRLKDIPVIISTADRTTRGLTGVPVDGKTSFINKASGLDNMRRGITAALGRQ